MIGVVGGGIAGLHVALDLQRRGVDVEVYGERTPDELRRGSMLNTVARFGPTRRREQALGLPDLPARTCAVGVVIHTNPVIGNPSLSFRGRVGEPWSFVDMRIVLADALAAYVSRGGRYQVGLLSDDAFAALGERSELLVVAAGRRGVDALFPVDTDRSVYSEPRRQLCAMFLEGLAPPPGDDFGYHVIPGVGELFQPAFTTVDGEMAGLLFEGIPGGAYADLAAMDYQGDPVTYNRTVLALLREFTPDVAALADGARFAVAGPRHFLRGAVTPRVRHGVARLPSGTWAIAIGDAWVTNDPVTGQGANTASYCAAVAAEAIALGGPYDEAFCRSVESAMWGFAGPVTQWTNATLEPPPEHVLGVLMAAANDSRVADAFIANFNDPPNMWKSLASPAGATDFLAAALENDAAQG